MSDPIIRRLYCTPATFKRVVGIQDTWSDEMLLEALDAATQKIDDHCRRFFYELQATFTFTARHTDRLLLDDDLVGLTTLTVDGTAWSTTDYALHPANARYQSPPSPYWEIVALPAGRRFPTTVNGVVLAGRWGFPLEWLRSGATVRNTAVDPDPPAGINDTTTSLPLSADDVVEVGHTAKLDDEQMYVTHVVSDTGGATATVERAVNGTDAATHAAAAPVYLANYPSAVRIACRVQANRYLHRPNAAFGVVGTATVGDIRLSARLDPDVEESLMALKKANS